MLSLLYDLHYFVRHSFIDLGKSNTHKANFIAYVINPATLVAKERG